MSFNTHHTAGSSHVGYINGKILSHVTKGYFMALKTLKNMLAKCLYVGLTRLIEKYSDTIST